MPTQYNSATEEMVLLEFQKKFDPDPVTPYQKSESPDGIIHTRKGELIGIEVTSAFINEESAKFINKYGLFNPKFPRDPSLLVHFKEGVYVRALISSIINRIQEKESNRLYDQFKSRFSKSVLVIYLDDLFITEDTLELVIANLSISKLLRNFNEAYLYIRATYHTSPSGIKYLGGFYFIGSQRDLHTA